MADVRPFRAVRYDTRHSSDVSACIAPPYDVLGESDKRALLERNADNIVAVDLPHTPPKSAGPPAAYTRAASVLRTWLANGTLVRDDRPAIYPYRQVFEHDGRRFARRGFIAVVRAEPFAASPAGIFPHEQTFSGPKEDRLALTRAARCQISPIFGLFPDEGNGLTDGLYESLDAQPTVRGRLGEVVHEAWRIDDPDRVAAVTEAMRDRPIFIADGHHRYTTALNYLAELEAGGHLPADHPARFVMFVCVSMHDPGLAILPTHRVVTVRPVAAKQLAERLDGVFDVQPTDEPCERLESRVLAAGPGCMAARFADGSGLLLRLVDRGVLDRLEPERGSVWRRLDVAVLHRYVLGEALASLVGEPAGVEYPHSGRDAASALAAARADGATSFGDSPPSGQQTESGDRTRIAFLLAPTPLEAVRAVCLSGELMPQKSTFFYPKLATGLTLHDLAD